MRLAYDATLDEAVDTNLRAMSRSKSVAAIRAKEIWITTIVSTIAVFVSWNVSSGAFKSAGSHLGRLAISAAVSIIIGGLIFLFYRRFYDRIVRRRVHRVTAEEFAKSSSHRCEIETRSEGLWVRQGDLEVTSSWRDLEVVLDSPDAIELHFRNGFVVVRNRVFESNDQRVEFELLCRTQI